MLIHYNHSTVTEAEKETMIVCPLQRSSAKIVRSCLSLVFARRIGETPSGSLSFGDRKRRRRRRTRSVPRVSSGSSWSTFQARSSRPVILSRVFLRNTNDSSNRTIWTKMVSNVPFSLSLSDLDSFFSRRQCSSILRWDRRADAQAACRTVGAQRTRRSVRRNESARRLSTDLSG